MNLKLKMQKEHQMKNPGMELNEIESVFGGNGTDPSFEKPSKW